MHGTQYPTWRSIARDYLAVMASSVASEWAFSSAGITISKRRNRLDADIVEALQCIKSLIQQDLMTRVFPTLADEEIALDLADSQPTNQGGSASEVVREAEDWTWDVVVEEAGADDAEDAEDDIIVVV